MFGLFDSRSEKLVKKIYKLNRELFAAARRAVEKDTPFSWKYLCETGRHIDEKIEELSSEMGMEYTDNLVSNLQIEQSFSLSDQEIFYDSYIHAMCDDILTGYGMELLMPDFQKIQKKMKKRK